MLTPRGNNEKRNVWQPPQTTPKRVHYLHTNSAYAAAEAEAAAQVSTNISPERIEELPKTKRKPLLQTKTTLLKPPIVDKYVQRSSKKLVIKNVDLDETKNSKQIENEFSPSDLGDTACFEELQNDIDERSEMSNPAVLTETQKPCSGTSGVKTKRPSSTSVLEVGQHSSRTAKMPTKSTTFSRTNSVSSFSRSRSNSTSEVDSMKRISPRVSAKEERTRSSSTTPTPKKTTIKPKRSSSASSKTMHQTDEPAEEEKENNFPARLAIYVHNFRCEYCNKILSVKIDPSDLHKESESQEDNAPATNTDASKISFRDVQLFQKRTADAVIELHLRSGDCPLVPLRCDIPNSETNETCGVICKGPTLMASHQERQCLNRLVECPNAHNGCEALISVGSISLHLKSCLQDLVRCGACKNYFEVQTSVECHKKSREFGWFPRHEIEFHKTVCPYTSVPCPIPGCRWCNYAEPNKKQAQNLASIIVHPISHWKDTIAPTSPRIEVSLLVHSDRGQIANQFQLLDHCSPAHLPLLTLERSQSFITLARKHSQPGMKVTDRPHQSKKPPLLARSIQRYEIQSHLSEITSQLSQSLRMFVSQLFSSSNSDAIRNEENSLGEKIRALISLVDINEEQLKQIASDAYFFYTNFWHDCAIDFVGASNALNAEENNKHIPAGSAIRQVLTTLEFFVHEKLTDEIRSHAQTIQLQLIRRQLTSVQSSSQLKNEVEDKSKIAKEHSDVCVVEAEIDQTDLNYDVESQINSGDDDDFVLEDNFYCVGSPFTRTSLSVPPHVSDNNDGIVDTPDQLLADMLAAQQWVVEHQDDISGESPNDTLQTANTKTNRMREIAQYQQLNLETRVNSLTQLNESRAYEEISELWTVLRTSLNYLAWRPQPIIIYKAVAEPIVLGSPDRKASISPAMAECVDTVQTFVLRVIESALFTPR